MRQTGRRKMALTQLGLLGCVLAGVLILGACQSNLGIPRQEAVAGPQGPEEALSRRQPWLIPLPEQRLLMVASVWRPQTSAPYPLAVISHASAENSELRTEDPTLKYEALARWLTQHGFVVTLPLRPGHSRTGGPYLEDQGGCDDADYVKSGLATAATIEATCRPNLSSKRVAPLFLGSRQAAGAQLRLQAAIRPASGQSSILQADAAGALISNRTTIARLNV